MLCHSSFSASASQVVVGTGTSIVVSRSFLLKFNLYSNGVFKSTKIWYQVSLQESNFQRKLKFRAVALRQSE